MSSGTKKATYGACQETPSEHAKLINRAKFRNYVTGHEKKIGEKQDKTTKAKDSAQSSASVTLSVTLIAVLKNLIESGPDKTSNYYLSMVLVCATLILQIIAGLLAISLTFLGKQMQKDEERTKRAMDVLERISEENVAGKKDVTQDVIQVQMQETALDSTDLKKPDQAAVKIEVVPSSEQRALLTKDSDDSSGLCNPCCAGVKKKLASITVDDDDDDDEFEQQVLSMCKDNTEMSVFLNGLLSDIQLDAANSEMVQFYEMMEVVKGIILYKKHVARLHNIQRTVTVLFFIICILNAFIAGLGIAKNV